MTKMNLNDYIARAAELESAIYTQKRLMDEHQSLIAKQRPAMPQKPVLQAPVKPTQPPTSVSSKDSRFLIIFVAAFVLIGCIALISAIPVLGLIVLGACLFGLFNIISTINRDKDASQKAQQKFELDMIEYNHKMEEFRKRNYIIEKTYSEIMQNWRTMVDEYDDKYSIIANQHDSTLTSLENALQQHYEQNIIFPKYRNFVAISTINEYLLSGRCYELEGPNGAYNLFEMELRQNIIIGQLSSIMNSLEQIRNNQFSLYQELVKANATVDDILHEVKGVKENTRLTAYFARVTALIEASPKIYIGHSF